jgi:hypothetical protein
MVLALLCGARSVTAGATNARQMLLLLATT